MKGKIKVVVISDTHARFETLEKIVNQEQGDIFIHAGDFTYYGEQKYFQYFFNILQRLKFKHKIVIAGNHEIMLDNGCIHPKKKEKYLQKYPCKIGRQDLIKELKKRCIYLEHELVEVEGLKIFGSPYTKTYCGSAFQYEEEYERAIWDEVPPGLDLLITHSPPYKVLDETKKGKNAGSTYLREIVSKKKPRFHIFGHIHEARGNLMLESTIYLNVARHPKTFMI